MVDCTRILLLSLLIALGISSPLRAEPSLPADVDAQVEQGIAAYDAGDYKTAKAILLPLAEVGHPKAMNMIGLMHKFSKGFSTNHKTACDWYEKSAAAGYPSGMYNISICYNYGTGRQHDHEQMLYWRTMAANHNHTTAMINLAAEDSSYGETYQKWMIKAANNGSTFAEVALWYRDYTNDVPNIKLKDIICVTWNIILLDKNLRYCD